MRDFLWMRLLAPKFVLVPRSDELQLALLLLIDEPLLLQHSQMTANATITITRITIAANMMFGVVGNGAEFVARIGKLEGRHLV